MGLLEHPEDLGAVSSGLYPGSLWRFSNILDLLNFKDVEWGAIAQSDWGTPYVKPTRLLGRLRGIDTMRDFIARQRIRP